MAGRQIAAIALISLPIVAGPAMGQAIQLPEISITASPIQRRAMRAAATPGPRDTVPEPPAAAPTPGPQWPIGVLPVVTHTFAPVTIIPGFEIESSATATLGDTMFSRPGLTSSTYAPGASRPIIRGMDNYRVRIQENGIGSHDLSALGRDHAVTIDPLSADRIEVIRGPATLRWGSQAIGGVVNADNNRIPTRRIEDGFNARFQGARTTVDNGYESQGVIEAGGKNFALHVDAFDRRSEDYRIPDGSRQLNTWVNTHGHAIGGSFVSDNGFIGVALSRYLSRYGIPGKEAVANQINIDLDQANVHSRGELRLDGGFISTIRYWYGATQYQHDELGSEHGLDGILSTFKNRQQEGRVEFQHAAIGPWTGAFGFQYGNQLVSTDGEAEEYLLPARTRDFAGYLFEEYALARSTKFQLAGRMESVKVTGTAGLFQGLLPTAHDDHDHHDDDHDSDHAHAGPSLKEVSRRFLPVSASAGFLQDLPFGIQASLAGQYTERAPRAAELFAKGAHHASETFEIGNRILDKEKASSVEFGLRRKDGPWRFDATAYYTQFRGFIYKQLTGNTCGHAFDECVPGSGENLNQIIYAQRDATFKGVEVATQLDVLPIGTGIFGVEGQYDIVDARFGDGSYVPRMPPQRVGGGLFWRSDAWYARVNLLHAFAQNHVADRESATPGYNLLNAELSYRQKIRSTDFGDSEWSFGIAAKNLLDHDVRNSASFRKDEVLLAGRNFKLFARLTF